MTFKSISEIAGSAMAAQTVRLNTIASNLANADSVAGTEADTYRARKPVFAAVMSENSDGMVFYPNVSQVAEMTDMMSASRAFETNVEVLGRVQSMQTSLLKLGEG